MAHLMDARNVKLDAAIRTLGTKFSSTAQVRLGCYNPVAMPETASPAAPSRDLATIIAISLIAFALSDFFHEGVGHGGACLLSGGHAQVLSTVHFECDLSNRFISAGGTLINLLAGFLCWMALRLANPTRERWRYFLWLSMTVNLFQGTGYFLFSGVGNFGDWADVIHGLQPAWLWRTALATGGLVSYWFAVWLALLELRQFLGPNDYHRGAAKDLTLVPYFTGGILSVIAGLFNPIGMILVAVSAAAASFGGTSGLAWMTQILGTPLVPKIPSRALTLPRSPILLVAAALTAAAFIGILGPSIHFH